MQCALERVVEERRYKRGKGTWNWKSIKHDILARQFKLYTQLRPNSIQDIRYLITYHQSTSTMLSNLLRDMTMSSTSNSNLNLNYTPSSKSKSQKHTSTTVTECSDTASLSSQKTLVGKVFGRKCESHIHTCIHTYVHNIGPNANIGHSIRVSEVDQG